MTSVEKIQKKLSITSEVLVSGKEQAELDVTRQTSKEYSIDIESEVTDTETEATDINRKTKLNNMKNQERFKSDNKAREVLEQHLASVQQLQAMWKFRLGSRHSDYEKAYQEFVKTRSDLRTERILQEKSQKRSILDTQIANAYDNDYSIRDINMLQDKYDALISSSEEEGISSSSEEEEKVRGRSPIRSKSITLQPARLESQLDIQKKQAKLEQRQQSARPSLAPQASKELSPPQLPEQDENLSTQSTRTLTDLRAYLNQSLQKKHISDSIAVYHQYPKTIQSYNHILRKHSYPTSKWPTTTIAIKKRLQSINTTAYNTDESEPENTFSPSFYHPLEHQKPVSDTARRSDTAETYTRPSLEEVKTAHSQKKLVPKTKIWKALRATGGLVAKDMTTVAMAHPNYNPNQAVTTQYCYKSLNGVSASLFRDHKKQAAKAYKNSDVMDE